MSGMPWLRLSRRCEGSIHQGGRVQVGWMMTAGVEDCGGEGSMQR